MYPRASPAARPQCMRYMSARIQHKSPTARPSCLCSAEQPRHRTVTVPNSRIARIHRCMSFRRVARRLDIPLPAYPCRRIKQAPCCSHNNRPRSFSPLPAYVPRSATLRRSKHSNRYLTIKIAVTVLSMHPCFLTGQLKKRNFSVLKKAFALAHFSIFQFTFSAVIPIMP